MVTAVHPSTALVSDDGPEVARSEAKLLSQQGHQREAPNDPIDAQEALLRRSFDLVVSDPATPRKSGVEFRRDAIALYRKRGDQQP